MQIIILTTSTNHTNFDMNFKLKLRMLFVNALFQFCLQEVEDPKPSLPENDMIPLNEYRRNKLMRLSEILQNKRNRFDDGLEEN